jgi:hypothetical protein
VVEIDYVNLVVLTNKDDTLELSFNSKDMNAIMSGILEE